MRKLKFLTNNVVLLVIGIAFISCEGSDVEPHDLALDKSTIPSKEITVTADNVLAFSNLESFLFTKDLISRLDETELEAWKSEFRSFVSLEDLTKEFIDDLSKKISKENLGNLSLNSKKSIDDFFEREIRASQYADSYYYENGSYRVNLFDPILANLLDVNRAVKIGSLFYVFDHNSTKVLKSSDYSLIDKAKDAQESGPLVDVHLVSQNSQNEIRRSSIASQALTSIGSTTKVSDWTDFHRSFAGNIDFSGKIDVDIVASRWGFPEYELVSPCPNDDPFGGISLECEVFIGYAYTTSAYVDTWVRIYSYRVGADLSSLSRNLKVEGNVSFPTIGIYNMQFNHIVYRPGVFFGDFSTSFNRLYIHSYQGESTIANFDVSIEFDDSTIFLDDALDLTIVSH